MIKIKIGMQKLRVENYITYIKNEEDVPYLRTQLLDVNMWFYNNKKNPIYHSIIKNCCDYIRFIALQEMEGYKKPHGMSGANVGIPFNIIGVVRNRDKDNEFCEIMINPKITRSSAEKEMGLTNCGSIRLAEPINVQRSKCIDLEWYNEEGVRCYQRNIKKSDGGFTIQHEVEHNLGILIIDLVPADLPF